MLNELAATGHSAGFTIGAIVLGAICVIIIVVLLVMTRKRRGKK